MCPEANLKSHQCDALVILTNMILISAVFFGKNKNCFFLSRAVWVHREGALPFPQHCRLPLSVAVPPSHPKPPHPHVHTFSSTSLRSCSHSRVSSFTRFCVKSRVSLRDSP